METNDIKANPIVNAVKAGRVTMLVLGNFKDFTIKNNQLYYKPYQVYHELIQMGYVIILFSLSGGVQIFNRNELPKNVLRDVNEQFGRFSIKENITNLNEEMIRLFRSIEKILLQKQKHKIAFIADYFEHFSPNPNNGGNSDDKIIAAETIHKLSNNPQLRNTGNLIICIAREGLYNPLLNDLERVEFPLPNENETASFAKVIVDKVKAGDTRYALLDDEITFETFGRLTKGMKLNDCEDIFTEANIRQQKVDRRIIIEIKQKAVLKNSENTLSLIDTTYDLGSVIGLDVAKGELRKQAELLRNGDPRTARGILLMGKPGIGKTYMVSAMAAEAGCTLLKYNQVKNMYVGESERLEDKAQEIIKASAPCIVFIDEIDLSMSNRESGQNLDGGVTNSIEQKRYEFMALEENRGNIVFVAATNHIENLDPAVISRFSKKIPIPGPTASEIPQHFRKCQVDLTDNDDLDLNDPKIKEAALVFWNKGADGRVIRDFVSSTDFTPSGILNAANSFMGKSKRNDEICAELLSCEKTEDIRLLQWSLDPKNFVYAWYFDDKVDKITGDYDKTKSMELRIQLKNGHV